MTWPASRECPLDRTTPSLCACWERSREQIRDLVQELQNAGVPDLVRTVYVSGSLGRMEAVASSDCDVVVVLTERDRGDSSLEIIETVFDCVARTGFQRPKREGIFGTPTSFEQLLDDTTCGKVDEDLGVFGKRIQALLDSQPLLHVAEFENLQRAILDRYTSAPVADAAAFSLGWLVDDLIRYWRSLCARTRWLAHDKEATWRSLNVKVRHSRMLLCAGLFQLLLEVRDSEEPIDDLVELLQLVPLERVARNISRGHAGELRQHYERFAAAMSEGLTNVVRDTTQFDNLIANGSEMAKLLGQASSSQFGAAMQTGWFGEL